MQSDITYEGSAIAVSSSNTMKESPPDLDYLSRVERSAHYPASIPIRPSAVKDADHNFQFGLKTAASLVHPVWFRMNL